MTASTRGSAWAMVSGRVKLTSATALLLIFSLTILTHLPTDFDQFTADDYLIRVMLMGDADLYQRGFTLANPDKAWWQRLTDAFHFYSPAAGTLDQYRDYGNLSWWASESAHMTPFRPLAAITHWLDFVIAPDSLAWQNFHSLLYILLFAWAGWNFYRRQYAPAAGREISQTALLATLLLVLDLSHMFNYSWVAARNVFIVGALGIITLNRFIRAQEQHSTWMLVQSCCLFVLALLTAEAAVGVLGYLLAYQVWMGKGSLWRRAMSLLPFGVILLVWRGLYNAAGFGASGIGLYADPGHDPLSFLASAVITFPVLLASPFITIDDLIGVMSPQARPWLALVCGLIAVVGVVLARGLLRQPRTRFLLTGSVLAAIPAATLVSGGPRCGVFIALGFFAVMANWLQQYLAKGRGRGRRIVVGAILFVHVLVPVLFGFFTTSTLLPVIYSDAGQYESVAGKLTPGQIAQRSLVVVNSRGPNSEYYLPFMWRINHGTAPQSVNVMAPAFVSMKLTRLDQIHFELFAPQGLPLDHTQTIRDLEGRHPAKHYVYSYALLQDLFASPATRFVNGSQFRSGDMTVTVTDVVDGRPRRLSLAFVDGQDPDLMLWQWFDSERREYRALRPPEIGQSLFFPGPLDRGIESFAGAQKPAPVHQRGE